ncbi:DUF1249 domain-containing protein [Marinimicrobium sp. ARAG 43.8]|uniref:DUF1249 domain-containing protein n=1 Tax=Marinimicrobium sp. ARAG 43.8 TaxID=3418719 RepID=UPI003CF82C8C
MVNNRYKVNLSRQLAECEANYWRLSKLLPNAPVTVGDEWQFAISSGDRHWRTRLLVTESSRYTVTVQLSQLDNMARDSQPWKAPQLTVRLYVDAQLAEVLAWEHHRRLQPRYAYPNRAMYQQDEKAQLNRFLGEWLGLCLEKGHSLEPVW